MHDYINPNPKAVAGKVMTMANMLAAKLKQNTKVHG